MPKAVLFDLDGTLVDSRGDIALSVNIMLSDMGFPAREDGEIYGLIGGGVHKLVIGALPPGRDDLVDEGVEKFWTIYKEHVLDTTRAYAGIHDSLKAMSPLKLAVATNKPLTHAELILEGLRLSPYFSSIRGWKPGLPVKPDPAILLLALEDLDVRPGDAVMVGDGINDVLAARAAGMKCCLVGYGYGKKERLLDANPDYFADSVSDLEGVVK